ncbi:MAG: recombination-associated protein RdgC [Gammaproteobacteria bacterium]|nr:recombination-associated protein RdgC [Gammaproteobacteria bacterium]
MWFKQVHIFQLNEKFLAYEPEKIAEQLGAFGFTPCLPSLPASYGFVPPLGNEEGVLVHAVNQCLFFCLQFEEKILPSSVVRQAVNDRVSYLAREYDRKISAKEKKELKEEMTQTLLTRAFTKISKLYAYIDIKNHWLVLDTNSASKTEKCIELLYRCFEEIQVSAIDTKNVSSILTTWLMDGDCSPHLFIGSACVLRDPQQKNRVVRCQNQPLFAEGILSLVKEGCEVNQLALDWHDRVSFCLTEKFALTSVRFHDAVLQLAKEQSAETEQQRMDADFFIMTETLQEIIHELLSVFSKSNKKMEKQEEVVA